MPNVQHDLQVADFQAFEKHSAPRSKFVKVALSGVCIEGGRLQLLRKEWGNAGKSDTFGRSAG